MDADADAGREAVRLPVLGQPPLNGDRARERGAGAVERSEEAVAGVLDHLASVRLEQLAQRAVVPAEQARPGVVAERARERGRVDDVGEEERPVGLLTAAVALQLGDPARVRYRSQPLEHRLGRVELELGGTASPARRYARARSTRVRAASYGTSARAEAS